MVKSKTAPAVQLDLFLPRPKLPQWGQLPPEVRDAVAELLGHMLCGYLTGYAPESSEEEVDHE